MKASAREPVCATAPSARNPHPALVDRTMRNQRHEKRIHANRTRARRARNDGSSFGAGIRVASASAGVAARLGFCGAMRPDDSTLDDLWYTSNAV